MPRKPSTHATTKDLSGLQVELQPEVKLSFADIFGNTHPVHIDIGCGKGRILLLQPLGANYNYLGIERRWKNIRFSLERLASTPLTNVRLIHAQAQEVLTQHLDDNSVDRYSVLFPDPWPKRRHLKRRIWEPHFLQQLHRTLKASGVLWIATDHQEYFSAMMQLIEESKLWQSHPGELPPPSMTHFEIKYTAQQRPICRAAFKRVATV